jgi:hypothetical protein
MNQLAYDENFPTSWASEGSVVAFPILIVTNRIPVHVPDGHIDLGGGDASLIGGRLEELYPIHSLIVIFRSLFLHPRRAAEPDFFRVEVSIPRQSRGL